MLTRRPLLRIMAENADHTEAAADAKNFSPSDPHHFADSDLRL